MKDKTVKEIGVPAEYIDQIIPDYQGNPLIESLPPILSKEEVYKKLASYPKISEEQKELDGVYRLHMVKSIKNYFQPFQDHIALEQTISSCIRQGYIDRNPLDPKQVSRFYDSHSRIVNKEPYEYCLEEQGEEGQSGMVFIGSSGIGKSTSMGKILRLYPQVISHEKLTRIQLTYLKVKCSYNGGLTGLCYNFFTEIDKLLGTNHTEYVMRKNVRLEGLTNYMEHIASLYCLGILVIDEIQHLNVQKSGGAKIMLNFFVSLMNKIGLPVILIGTPKALKVLTTEFRQIRRLTADAPELWDPMQNDATWRLFLKGLWKYQWTKNYTPLTEELINLMHDESQGILAVAQKLFRFTQEKAINKGGKEIITPQLIKQVKKEKFSLMEKMLLALKEDAAAKLDFYDDIKPVKRKVVPLNQTPINKKDLKKALQEIEQQKVEKEVVYETKLDKTIAKLQGMGLGMRKAKKYAHWAIEELGENETEEKLALKAISFEFVQTKNKDSIKNTIAPKSAEDDDDSLLTETSSDGEEMKEIFKKKGLVQVPKGEMG